MTFGPNHYMPVLKVKRGEKSALLAVPPALRARMTPILEIVERKPEKAATIAMHLDTAFKDLASSAAGYGRVFLDAREIASDGTAGAQEVFQRAKAAGMNFVPVTGLHRASDLQPALAHQAHGLAVRLTRDEFEAGGLKAALQAFMTKHSLAHHAVDLVVDLGAVDDMVAAGVMSLTSAYLAEVPDVPKWRSLTVSGCAFPKSMGGVGTNTHSLVERAEWLAWRDGLYSHRAKLLRLPTFSDCAIQYPSGVEGFDPRIMPVSASVRYTRDEDWLLIKGESTRKTPPSVQFPQLAVQLVYGHLHGHFDGAVHCSGCVSMKAAADGAPRLGSAEAWRRLGTIHHLTTVLNQLAALA